MSNQPSLTGGQIPSIATKRLTLRPFNEADVEPLYLILNDGDVLRYFPNPSAPPRDRVERLVSNILAHWQEHGFGWWALEQPAEPGLMGWCGLTFLPETVETEVAYCLGKPHWGKGFATEAASASLRFGFQTIALPRIIGLVHPENRASAHVLEKLGMSLIDRNRYFGMDVLRYWRDRDDWLVAHDQT
jgi:ribosomal-protein-alanine N-acetyltransferase